MYFVNVITEVSIYLVMFWHSEFLKKHGNFSGLLISAISNMFLFRFNL